MARFTIRIELIDATWEQYAKMYEHLENVSIVDEIVDKDGNRYRLPPAEYNYEGDATVAQVLNIASAAARKVVREHRVLVTKSAGRTWHNLEKI